MPLFLTFVSPLISLLLSYPLILPGKKIFVPSSLHFSVPLEGGDGGNDRLPPILHWKDAEGGGVHEAAVVSECIKKEK